MHATTLPPQSAALRLHTDFAHLVDKMQPLFALVLRLYVALVLDRWFERRPPA